MLNPNSVPHTFGARSLPLQSSSCSSLYFLTIIYFSTVVAYLSAVIKGGCSGWLTDTYFRYKNVSWSRIVSVIQGRVCISEGDCVLWHCDVTKTPSWFLFPSWEDDRDFHEKKTENLIVHMCCLLKSRLKYAVTGELEESSKSFPLDRVVSVIVALICGLDIHHNMKFYMLDCLQLTCDCLWRCLLAWFTQLLNNNSTVCQQGSPRSPGWPRFQCNYQSTDFRNTMDI